MIRESIITAEKDKKLDTHLKKKKVFRLGGKGLNWIMSIKSFYIKTVIMYYNQHKE